MYNADSDGFERYKPEGKLKALVKIFQQADDKNDHGELIDIMGLLEENNWDTRKVSLLLKLEHYYKIDIADLETFETLVAEFIENGPDVILTEEQKLDCILEMANCPVVNYDHKEVKTIVEALIHRDDLRL